MPIRPDRLRTALLALALGLLPIAAAAEDTRTLRWPELIPGHLADAPVRPPSIEDHSGPVDLTQLSPWGDLPMSELVVPEVDGEQVRISGFVVPLHMTGDDRVDEFLLVPYFGACVHVPPPPPNQVIHVIHERGLDAARIYDPWTVVGTLRVRGTSNAMADAGYTLDARTLRLYEG
jgi:hypothetical protein